MPEVVWSERTYLTKKMYWPCEVKKTEDDDTLRLMFLGLSEWGTAKKADVFPYTEHAETFRRQSFALAFLDAVNLADGLVPRKVPVARSPPASPMAARYNIEKGTMIRIRAADVIHHKLRSYALTSAMIVDVPVHPNTWYGVRLIGGRMVKIRKSAFDVEAAAVVYSDPVIYDPLSPIPSPSPLAQRSSTLTMGTTVRVCAVPYVTHNCPQLIGFKGVVVECSKGAQAGWYAVAVPKKASQGQSSADAAERDLHRLPRAALQKVCCGRNAAACGCASNGEDVMPSLELSPTAPGSHFWQHQRVRLTEGDWVGHEGTLVNYTNGLFCVAISTSSNKTHSASVSTTVVESPLGGPQTPQQDSKANLSQQPPGALRPSAFSTEQATVRVWKSIDQLVPLSGPPLRQRLALEEDTPDVRLQAQKVKRIKPLRVHLVGRYVRIAKGRYKGQVGYVSKGGNGYYMVHLGQSKAQVLKRESAKLSKQERSKRENVVMKRSADLQPLQTPPSTRELRTDADHPDETTGDHSFQGKGNSPSFSSVSQRTHPHQEPDPTPMHKRYKQGEQVMQEAQKDAFELELCSPPLAAINSKAPQLKNKAHAQMCAGQRSESPLSWEDRKVIVTGPSFAGEIRSTAARSPNPQSGFSYRHTDGLQKGPLRTSQSLQGSPWSTSQPRYQHSWPLSEARPHASPSTGSAAGTDPQVTLRDAACILLDLLKGSARNPIHPQHPSPNPPGLCPSTQAWRPTRLSGVEARGNQSQMGGSQDTAAARPDSLGALSPVKAQRTVTPDVHPLTLYEVGVSAH